MRLRPASWLLIAFLIPAGATRAIGTVSLALDQAYFATQFPTLRGGNAIAVSPDGNNIYAAGSSGTIVVFRRDAAFGNLTYVAGVPSTPLFDDPLMLPAVLQVSPDGGYVYYLRAATKSLAAFARNASGGTLIQTQVLIEGVAGVEGLDQPIALAGTPDGRYLYVLDAGGHMAVFARDALGMLSLVAVLTQGVAGISGLGHPKDIAVSPDGMNVYVIGDSLSTYARDGSTGGVQEIQVLADSGGHIVVVSPDGKNVYTTARGTGSLDLGPVAYTRSPADGTLGLLQSNLGYTNELLVSPSGDRVYDVYGFTSTTWLRDPSTGALALEPDVLFGQLTASTFFEPTYLAGGTIGTVIQSPDGRFLYASGPAAQSIAPSVYRLVHSCSFEPMPGCRQGAPRSSTLNFRFIRTSAETLSRVTFGFDWRGDVGPAIGDPTAGTDYATCMYVASLYPFPLMVLRAPAAKWCGALPCWIRKQAGLKYRDTKGIPDLVRSVHISDTSLFVTAQTVRIGGTKVDFNGAEFGLRTPLVVQIQNSDGGCWEAVFSRGDFSFKGFSGHSD